MTGFFVSSIFLVVFWLFSGCLSKNYKKDALSDVFFVLSVNYLTAFLAVSTKEAKAFGSLMANSDNIFLLMEMLLFFKPSMNLE